jgi:hypothetical protein
VNHALDQPIVPPNQSLRTFPVERPGCGVDLGEVRRIVARHDDMHGVKAMLNRLEDTLKEVARGLG